MKKIKTEKIKGKVLKLGRYYNLTVFVTRELDI